MNRAEGFWGRRRAGVAAEAQADAVAADEEAHAIEQAELAERSDAEILAELELPDPDTLKMGDDFSAFMAKAVPDRIRRRALRTLWRSNPVLANVDMLVDYGEDFTDAATVVENMQTAYQVGKGMMKHVEEMARKAAEAEAEAEDASREDDVETADEPPEEEMVAQEPVETPTKVALAETPLAEHEEEEHHAAPVPKRMKFIIEETA